VRVEFLLKTDSGYPKDTGVNKPWQPLGIPFAITPISQLHQSLPSPIPGDLEMGDVRAHGAIYTNTLLHLYLTKYPAYCALIDLQPRSCGHSASTRATCLKFLSWCSAQLQCTTASQETCGIGRAHPPASRKGTHTLCPSSPGARAHTAPNERQPLTHGNFRNAC